MKKTRLALFLTACSIVFAPVAATAEDSGWSDDWKAAGRFLAIPFDDWSSGDLWRQGIYLTALAVDCGQTINMSGRYNEAGHNYHEMNPLLGEYPDRKKVQLVCLGTAVLHTTVANYLPPKWRRIFQYSSIAIELPVIAHNYSIGLRIEF